MYISKHLLYHLKLYILIHSMVIEDKIRTRHCGRCWQAWVNEYKDCLKTVKATTLSFYLVFYTEYMLNVYILKMCAFSAMSAIIITYTQVPTFLWRQKLS